MKKHRKLHKVVMYSTTTENGGVTQMEKMTEKPEMFYS